MEKRDGVFLSATMPSAVPLSMAWWGGRSGDHDRKEDSDPSLGGMIFCDMVSGGGGKQLNLGQWMSLPANSTSGSGDTSPWMAANDNHSSIWTAVHNNGMLLEFASPRLQNNKDLVKIAVNQNGLALRFASGAVTSDSEIVRAAVEQNGQALHYAQKDVQNLVLLEVS